MDDDSYLDQQPVGPVTFAENPEPRCPCLLLLDTSGSMAGQPITELNAGLRAFYEELQGDSLASKRVEVALVSFGKGGGSSCSRISTTRILSDGRRMGMS